MVNQIHRVILVVQVVVLEEIQNLHVLQVELQINLVNQEILELMVLEMLVV